MNKNIFVNHKISNTSIHRKHCLAVARLEKRQLKFGRSGAAYAGIFFKLSTPHVLYVLVYLSIKDSHTYLHTFTYIHIYTYIVIKFK